MLNKIPSCSIDAGLSLKHTNFVSYMIDSYIFILIVSLSFSLWLFMGDFFYHNQVFKQNSSFIFNLNQTPLNSHKKLYFNFSSHHYLETKKTNFYKIPKFNVLQNLYPNNFSKCLSRYFSTGILDCSIVITSYHWIERCWGKSKW